jgi:hypothetical protein
MVGDAEARTEATVITEVFARSDLSRGTDRREQREAFEQK